MAGGQRDAFGIGRADHLGCDLAEHENHEGGGRRAATTSAISLSPDEPSRDLTDQKGGRGVDYVVAEQHDAQELIGLRQQIGGDASHRGAGLHEVAQPIPVERHHARLPRWRRKPKQTSRTNNATKSAKMNVVHRGGGGGMGRVRGAPEHHFDHEPAADVGEHEREETREGPAHLRPRQP